MNQRSFNKNIFTSKDQDLTKCNDMDQNNYN